MDTLDRYLIRETVIFLLLILLSMTFLYLGIEFLGNFWRSTQPLSFISRQYFYRIPSTISMFVPVSCLMATLLVLTSMSRQNEVLALYASSVSTMRILSTFVALVAVASTACFLVLDPMVPLFNRKQILLNQGKDPSSTENLSSFNRTNFWYRSGKLVYNFGQFVPETNTLLGVKIYNFGPDFYLMESIRAREAHYQNGDWIIRDGTVVTYPAEGNSAYPVATDFEIKQNVIPEKPKDFRALEVRDDIMRLKDLRQYIKRNQDYGLDTVQQQVNYHERVAVVFTPLVLVLLGFPFALKPLKTHSAARSIAFCFGVVIAYMLMSRLSLSIGKGGHIPPMVAAWAPNLFFLGIASFRLLRA